MRFGYTLTIYLRIFPGKILFLKSISFSKTNACKYILNLRKLSIIVF